MDRWRAAGALLALAACFACSAAAPTASNQTALDLYEGAPEGCYYNFQHYGEGDRIMTNEPCLNCTCHNRMLMCYLRVCPFTKAIGQDCTVEKRADQCCPIVTCPDVPVDLLTSTSTTSPAEYGATGLGKVDKYGCSINGKYFPEGSKVPPTPNKPCEHCYCIRNMTTCVMQECTLHVDGCTPIYHKDVCCPVRYSCDHPEDEVPLLDDMSTTVRPTPGFLLTTTTISPVTQMTQDCVHDDQIFADGALIKTEKACEHCYCMKGDIVCVVQECGAPMENEGKNCTSLPPREGQCCPDTYICEGDELSSELPTESTTEYLIEKQTTLLPPRRHGVEGSGYRNEPDEAPYTEIPSEGPEVEGSGEEQEPFKPLSPDEIIPTSEDGDQYIYVSTKAPHPELLEQVTTEINKNIIPELGEETVEPLFISTTNAPNVKDVDKLATSEITAADNFEAQGHVSSTIAPEGYEKVTTELGESLNTVPDVILEEELVKPHEYPPSTTFAPTRKESEITMSIEGGEVHTTTSIPAKSEPSTPSSSDEIEKITAEILDVSPDVTTEKEYTEVNDITKTTSATSTEQSEATQVGEEEKDIAKPEKISPSTTSYPSEESEKLTTEPDHAQNTVAVAEEESTNSHILTVGLTTVKEEITTVANIVENIVTDKVITDNIHEHVQTSSPTLEENEFIPTEPDRGLNTIPSEINEESSAEPSLSEKTTVSVEIKTTESSIITGEMQTHDVPIKQTVASETTTLLPEIMVTKGDQYTITTEPSFRKEDESSISTEKTKEFEPTTVKSEFAEEGLIPTSSHDDKLGTSTDAPSTDEEFTTMVPEGTKEGIAETTEIKQTTETILITSVVTESLFDKVSESLSEQDSESSSSTEKPTGSIALVPEDVETHEEPSRIPGEGDCLLNGVTYRNNSIVPSTNNCHTGCRCASSIIKCDPIICSPPPDYMDNCQSIYDSPDSCCPTYVCDHPKETVPPQSDNQMSGTESPLTSPTIECRGDQCEISEPAKLPSGPSEICTSGNCLTEADHKHEIDCGPTGCVETSEKPDIPPLSLKPAEDCTDGKCHLPAQILPIKPCEGKHCQKEEGVISLPSPQLCENENDCKALEIPVAQATPCEGESCNKIDCGNGGCDSNLPSPPNPQQVSIPVHECTGDEPCRRKETAGDETLPTKCEGSNCEDKPATQENIDLSTKLPIPEQTSTDVTLKEEGVEEQKATIPPESHTSTSDVKDTQDYTSEPHIGTATTEADIQKGKPNIKDETTKIPTGLEEESTEGLIVTSGDIEPTVKPLVFETERTETPTLIEKETGIPTTVDEETKKKLAIGEVTTKPAVIEIERTELPSILGEDERERPVQIDKVGISEEESTKKPTIAEEEITKKPALTEIETSKPVTSEEESTDEPAIEEGTEEPTLEKDRTEIPAVSEAETSEKPSLIDEKDKPLVFEKESTEEPSLVNESTEQKPIAGDEGKDKPIEEIATEKPVLIETEGMDKITTGEEKPAIIEEEITDKPARPMVTDVKEKPVVNKGESTEKSPINQVIPVIPEEEDTDKTRITEGTKIDKPDISEEGTEKPVIEDDKTNSIVKEIELTERPIITVTAQEEGTVKPDLIDEEKSSESPDVTVERSTDAPAIIEEHSTKHPDLIDKNGVKEVASEDDGTKKPDFEDNKDTKLPEIIGELSTEIPTTSDVEGIHKPTISEEENKAEFPAVDEELSTTKPVITEDEGSSEPAIEREGTEKPTIVEIEGTEVPAEVEKNDTDKPDLVEKESTKLPTAIEEEATEKPFIDEEIGTLRPEIPKEQIPHKPATTEKENTLEPVIVEKEGTEIPSLIDEDKVKPVKEEDIKIPPPFEEESTETNMLVEDGDKKPVIIDEEIEEKPTEGEVKGTEEPQVHEEEGSGTEIPEEPEKGVKFPETIEKRTESPVTELDKTMTVPIYESQPTHTDDIDRTYSTEINAIESVDEGTTPKVILSSETPEVKVTDSDLDKRKEPMGTDNSVNPDVTTEYPSEVELPTKTPLSTTISEEVVTSIPDTEKETVLTATEQNVKITTPKLDINVNVGQDMTSFEIVSTQGPELHETMESVEKSTEMGLIGGHEEVYTDTSELETTTSKEPGTGPVIIEPQEGIESDKPELVITDNAEQESTTKTYQEEINKPVAESHVTEVTSVLPEQYGTSERVSEAPEITQEEKQKPDLPELLSSEPDKLTTQLPANIAEEEIKTEHPEIYKPDEEEIITESPEYSATEPVRRFTDIEEMITTAEEDKATEYPKQSTEKQVPTATEKTDENIDVSITENPLITDVNLTKLPEKTPESDKITPEEQEHSTEIPESEKEKPDIVEVSITETSVPEVTEYLEMSHVPEKHVTEPSHEEKTTSIIDLSDQINKGTTLLEGYTTEKETDTTTPQHLTSSEPYSKGTESYTTDQHVTEVQETSTKSDEKDTSVLQSISTEVPKTSIKEEDIATKAPEITYTESHAPSENEPFVTETEKLATESPTSLENIQTETPAIRFTSEVPQSLVTVHQEVLGEETVSSLPEKEPSIKPELQTTQFQDNTKAPELYVTGLEEIQTETPVHFTEAVGVSTKEPEIIDKITKVTEEVVTEKQDTLTTLRETPAASQEIITVEPEAHTILPQFTTAKHIDEVIKSTEHTSAQTEFSETTPYLIELEEHTHKILEELSTLSPSEEEHTHKAVEDVSTPLPSIEEYTHKIEEHLSTVPPSFEKHTTEHAETVQESHIFDLTTKISDDRVETVTKEAESASSPSEVSSPSDVSEKITESLPAEDTTPVVVLNLDNKHDADHKEVTTSPPSQISEESTSAVVTESDKLPFGESEIPVPVEKETSSTEKPIASHETSLPEEEFIFSTTKATTVRQEDNLPPVTDDKFVIPEEKPLDTSGIVTTSTTEVPKPSVSDMQPTDEIPAPEEEGHFPPSGTTGYGEPDYVEEDQAFGPGTCRYGGKVYVSAQQIPRDDPCDFCFCFRSDIICLQQSCPPPIHGCHEEPIQGFCCPRYECPVSMATTVNVTTTTTTTTTTLPPHFPTHSYKGAAQRRGCQIKGHTYKVGEVVRSSSGPCLHCTCGGDGQMKCDPKACTPEPMLRQMIAAAVSAKRRR